MGAGDGAFNTGEGNGMVVQPENLGETAARHEGDPHFRQALPAEFRDDWAGEAARFGAPAVEYYKNGRPLPSSSKTSSGHSGSNNSGSSGNKNDRGGLPPPPRGGASYENTDDNVSQQFLDWAKSQSGANNYGQEQRAREGEAPRGGAPQEGPPRGQAMDYDEWLSQKYGRSEAEGRARGSSGSSVTLNNQFLEAQPGYDEWLSQKYGQAEAEGRVEGSAAPPQDDLDVVSGKQVILRPRLPDGAGERPKRSSLPPLGRTADGAGPVVYYYDPRTLRSPSDNNRDDESTLPELTLPEVVYDAAGRALRLEQVHAGGRNEVFLEVKPRAVWGDSLAGWGGELGSELRSRLQLDPSLNSSAPQSQDQLIVFLTVATMAVAVGALAAQRLRSKRMLESCMHPELDDEDWEEDFDGGTVRSVAASVRYDKKFDVDAGRSVAGSSPSGSGSTGLNSGGSGFGTLLGGRREGAGRYYGSGSGGAGGLHWRGDAEKFDV